MLNSIEIIIIGLPTSNLDDFLRKDLKISSAIIRSSHFYDEIKKIDITYDKIEDFQKHYWTGTTGNILLKALKIGDLLEDVMLIISANSVSGDVILNFHKNNFDCKSKDIEIKIKNIIKFCEDLIKKIKIREIRIGYESAYDDDMVLLVMDNTKISITEKNLCEPLQKKILKIKKTIAVRRYYES